VKSPHFYCENCGKQVPSTAKVCPGCGRFFSDVRCPRCGRTGQPEEFTSGCPDCGYSGGTDGTFGRPSGKNLETYNPDMFKTPRRASQPRSGLGPFIIAMAAAGLCLLLALILYFVSRR
jgi:uncharacterized membrane protein YvbJ